MRLTLHIFRKDARRCWKEIAMTLAMLAWLTRMDSWRSGNIPDSSEGWLNLLLPLAWGYLVAACILQDPVPGERQFWLTLPCRPRTLFSSKALFILTFIHLPCLISNALVLDARGFAWWRFLPRLAEQQLFLALAVTLPAIALSTLARSATQFIALALALLGAAVVFSSASETIGLPLFPSAPWMRVDGPRQALALLTIAISAFLVTVLQYRMRRTASSRAVGVAGLAAAAALYVWMPKESSAAIESALWPAPVNSGPLSLRLGHAERPFEAHNIVSSNAVLAAIPVELGGLSAFRDADVGESSVEILGPGATHVRAAQRFDVRNKARLYAYLGTHDWQILSMEPEVFARLAGGPVTVRGYLSADLHTAGAPVFLSENTRFSIPQVGTCARSGADGGLLREDGLRVTCEYPGSVGNSSVRLSDTETGRQWTRSVGVSGSFVTYPRNAWLSPVERREAFFQLSSRDTMQPGSQWQAPRTIVAHSRMEVIPNPSVGHKVARFELTGIRLRDYIVKPDR